MVVSGLTHNTIHQFRVRSRDGEDTSDWSDPIAARTQDVNTTIVQWHQITGRDELTGKALSTPLHSAAEADFGITQSGYWGPPICLVATFNLPDQRRPKYIKFWLRGQNAVYRDYQGDIINSIFNVGGNPRLGDESAPWQHKYRVHRDYVHPSDPEFFNFQASPPPDLYVPIGSPSAPTGDDNTMPWRAFFGSVWDNNFGSRTFKWVKNGIIPSFDPNVPYTSDLFFNNNRWLNPSYSNLVTGNVSDLFLHKQRSEWEDALEVDPTTPAFNPTIKGPWVNPDSSYKNDSVYTFETNDVNNPITPGAPDSNNPVDPWEYVEDTEFMGTELEPVYRTHFIYMSIKPDMLANGGTYNGFSYRISFIYG